MACTRPSIDIWPIERLDNIDDDDDGTLPCAAQWMMVSLYTREGQHDEDYVKDERHAGDVA